MLLVRRIVRTVVPAPMPESAVLALTRPAESPGGSRMRILTFSDTAGRQRVLAQVGDTVLIDAVPVIRSQYDVACDLAATYRLNPFLVRDAVQAAYGPDAVPDADMTALAAQVEQQTRRYTVTEERIDVALAMVKPSGFAQEHRPDGTRVYTAQIAYPVDRERLLIPWESRRRENPHDFGFFYTPLGFDSDPEISFFDQLLRELNLHPTEVEDIYFTGGLTDPAKTDFFVEYKDEAGKWRKYTPD